MPPSSYLNTPQKSWKDLAQYRNGVPRGEGQLLLREAKTVEAIVLIGKAAAEDVDCSSSAHPRMDQRQ